MAYTLVVESFNYIVLFMGVLFASGIAAEWLKDDMKHVYKIFAFTTVGILGLLLGFELFTENISYYNGAIMQFPPLGWAFIMWGAFNLIIPCLTVWNLVTDPYRRLDKNGRV